MEKLDHLIAPPEEHKLLDRPAEERLREELNAQNKKKDDQQHKKLEDEKPKQPKGRTMVLIGLALLILFLLVFFLGYLPRHRREQQLEREARRERESLPVAYVMQVQRSTPKTNLQLPGNTSPLQEASLFARASGYVKKRYVDIGDRVREGQLLAEIEAPELDQQVAQARAGLSQAEAQVSQARANLDTQKANLDLATVTYNRYRVLVEHGVLAKQEGDQQLANLRTAQANVHAAEETVRGAEDNVRAAKANLDRVIALQQFEKVRAPFTGVVTARNFDVGTLVSGSGAGSGSGVNSQSAGGNSASGGATSSSGTGTTTGGTGELFRIAQVGILRILINVPQPNAPTIHVGQEATVTVQGGERRVIGHVTRTANAIDVASRTLLTEIQVPNADGKLLPGMYAQIEITNVRVAPPLLVPGDALITRSGGTFVAMLEDPTPQEKQQIAQEHKDDKGDSAEEQKSESQEQKNAKRVHLQRVEIGRDYGTDIEIVGGLKGDEFVVVNPGDAIHEGGLINPQTAPAPPKATNPGGLTDKRPAGISSPGEAAQSQSAGGPAQGGAGAAGGKGGGSGQGGSGGSGGSGKAGKTSTGGDPSAGQKH